MLKKTDKELGGSLSSVSVFVTDEEVVNAIRSKFPDTTSVNYSIMEDTVDKSFSLLNRLTCMDLDQQLSASEQKLIQAHCDRMRRNVFLAQRALPEKDSSASKCMMNFSHLTVLLMCT